MIAPLRKDKIVRYVSFYRFLFIILTTRSVENEHILYEG